MTQSHLNSEILEFGNCGEMNKGSGNNLTTEKKYAKQFFSNVSVEKVWQ